MNTAYESSEVLLRPAANFGTGVVLWRVFRYEHGLSSSKRLSWFPNREAARKYMLRHPELTVRSELKSAELVEGGSV